MPQRTLVLDGALDVGGGAGVVAGGHARSFAHTGRGSGDREPHGRSLAGATAVVALRCPGSRAEEEPVGVAVPVSGQGGAGSADAERRGGADQAPGHP